MLDTFIIALLTIFLGFRLFSVLGKHGDTASRPDLQLVVDNDGETHTPGAGKTKFEVKKTKLKKQLAALKDLDPFFDEKEFLRGAKAAFDMIVAAFAAGDEETLKKLLAGNVFDDFKAVIDQRRKDNLTQQTKVVAVNRVGLERIGIIGDEAALMVVFESEQINLTKDAENRIIAGDPHTPDTVTDVWTFRRDMTSDDPNWALVSTGAQDA